MEDAVNPYSADDFLADARTGVLPSMDALENAILKTGESVLELHKTVLALKSAGRHDGVSSAETGGQGVISDSERADILTYKLLSAGDLLVVGEELMDMNIFVIRSALDAYGQSGIGMQADIIDALARYETRSKTVEEAFKVFESYEKSEGRLRAAAGDEPSMTYIV
jgi:hypothetical protein